MSRYWGAGAAAGVTLLAVSGAGLWLNERGDEPVRALAPVTSPSATPSVGTSGEPSANPSGGPSPSSSASTSSTASPRASTSGTARAAGVPQALRTCGSAVQAAERVVGAEQTGAGHWRRHVQAYRDLVDGDIPYRQADREWRSTKKEGPKDVRRFSAALRTYDKVEADCASAPRQVGPEHADLARACAQRHAAADRAAASGRRVMDNWKNHLEQMEGRRTHKLSDDRARKLFRAAVRAAPGQLKAFDADRDRLQEAPACRVPRA